MEVESCGPYEITSLETGSCFMDHCGNVERFVRTQERETTVLVQYSTTKTYGGVHVYSHVFLTSALVGGEWSASHPGRFTLEGRAPGTHWIGGWVGPTASLDDVEKGKFLTLPGFELRPLGHPASSQSLYRLRYLGSLLLDVKFVIFSQCVYSICLDWLVF
jgi:hypothetical protein